ncbi:MAG: acyl-CoA thioesterase [Deferribacteraceae bacterium]|jgi:acyl-CoA thioester hydrolase|nr:acyl-CoA thioesterase [Deferribacteraceae bacterium]
MEKTVEIQVRFRDLDAYGHVNNAVYMSYLEIARVELIKDLFLQDMAENIQYLLVSVKLDYRQPIRLSDKALVHCEFNDIGKVRFKVLYKVHNGEGKIFAEGYSVHALFNGNTNRPMRLPEEWIARVR